MVYRRNTLQMLDMAPVRSAATICTIPLYRTREMPRRRPIKSTKDRFIKISRPTV